MGTGQTIVHKARHGAFSGSLKRRIELSRVTFSGGRVRGGGLPARGGLVAALLFCTAAGCSSGLRSGGIAPDFTLDDVGDRPVPLSTYRGDVVMLCFWAVG